MTTHLVLNMRAGVLVTEADGGALSPPLGRSHRRESGEYFIRRRYVGNSSFIHLTDFPDI